MSRSWLFITTSVLGMLFTGCSGGGQSAGNPAPQGTPTAAHAAFLYTANETSGNVSGYSMDPSTGALAALAGFPVPSGANPVFLTHDALNKFLIAVDIALNTIHVFGINSSTGALTEIPPSPYAAGKEPRAAAIDPSGKFVYVASQSLNSVAAFTMSSSGVLTPVPGSPFATGGTSTTGSFGCCVVVDPSGKFLYVQDTVNVYSFTINGSSGALTLTGTVAGPGFGNALAVDPAGTFLYAVGSGMTSIQTFTINSTTGTLTLSSSSPLALHTGSFALTLDPAAHFAYTVEASKTVVGYSLQNGTFTSLGGSFSGAVGTQQLAIDPSGSFLYAPQTANLDNISGFQISSSGLLHAISGSPFSSGQQPSSAIIIPKQ